MITSKLDPLIPTDYDLSIFNPIVFTGSPDAARSILSAIAAGWTTILGVAFSVTLITLQLSSSKYVSRLITEFQNDKINQFALGWFIFVSSYSLMTLKTVITEESNGIFIPIIGTNISIAIAIAGLLIFVLYIHNISNYIRPNVLISRIVDSIISSLKKYEDRKIDKKLVFNRKCLTEEILSIRAPDSGSMSSIDWKKIQNVLGHFPTEKDLWLEWHKSIGDWVYEGEKLAGLYWYLKESEANAKLETGDLIGSFGDNIGRKLNGDHKSSKSNVNEDDISHITKQIEGAVQVLKDDNLTNDPILGIKLLEQIVLKSNKLNDYDVVNSLIIGLFRILIFVYFNEPKLGLPFTSMDNDKKTQKVRKIKLDKTDPDNKYGLSNDKNEKLLTKENTDSEGHNKNEQKGKFDHRDKRTIIINPKELKIQDVILETFKNIINAIYEQSNSPSNNLFCKQYISTCNYLLENNKTEEFMILTKWYSHRISLIRKEFSNPILFGEISNLLAGFKEHLEVHHPHAGNSYSFFMDKVIKDTAAAEL